MLKLTKDILLNENQIVAAELIAQGNSNVLKLTLIVPVTFGESVEGNPNQVLLRGNEAKNLWKVLSKDALEVSPAPKPFIAPIMRISSRKRGERKRLPVFPSNESSARQLSALCSLFESAFSLVPS